MHTYVFSGRVHPERTYVDITPHNPNITVATENGPLTIEVHYSIWKGQLMLHARSEVPVDVAWLKMMVEEIVSSQVDFLSYRLGRHYASEIISVLQVEENAHMVFGVGYPPLEADAENRPLEYGEAAQLSYQYVYLRRALGDLRRALGPTQDVEFLCYRAIESIRQHIKSQLGITNEKESWAALRERLNCDEPYLVYLTQYATPQRHGQLVSVLMTDREKVIRIAWSLVDRFILYLKNNEQGLALKDYPTLSI